MKEEPLHPWIEPELEARITALVLGEASDFEREELERLIEEKAELAMFRKRMEAVHGLLREVAAGEMGADDDDWKLSDERRQAVLAVIDGERREKVVENVVKENVVKLKPKRRNFFGNLAKIAAILLIPTIAIGILMLGISDYGSPAKIEGYAPPAYANKIEATKAAPYIDAESGGSASSYSPPIADSASVAKPDPMADSRSSLAAIQGNLDAYSNSPEAPNPSANAKSITVAGDTIEMPKVEPYLYADPGSGGAVRGVAGQAVRGVANLREGAGGIAMVEDKLKNIVIPRVEFQDTPLKEALAFLQEKSVEFDINEPDPSRKGINFGLKESTGGDEAGDTKITLKLSNVPLDMALKYTSALAQMKYKVEPGAVEVLPLSAPDTDLVTHTLKVPPTFLSAASSGGGDYAADPFADSADEGAGSARRRTAKAILQEAGVTFAPGSSAIYNPTTSQLTVRNTQDQIELVEAYTDSIKGKSEELSFPDISGVASMPIDAEQGFGMAISSLDIDDNNFMNGKINKGSSPLLGPGQTVAIPGQETNKPQSPAVTAKDSTGGSIVIDEMDVGGATRGGQVNIGGGFTVREARTKMDVPGNRKPQDLVTGNDSKMDRDGEVKGAKLGEDREEMLAARQLAEAQSPMARGQIAAADAPQPAPEEMAAGQGGAARKKEKAQAPSALAPAAPAGARPAPAAAPMLAKETAVREKDMNPSAEREADDEMKSYYASVGADGGMKSNYASTARNETRAEFLTEVAAGWELPVPTEIREGVDLNRADKEASSKTGGDIPQDLERFTPPQHERQNHPGSNKDAMDKAYQRTPQVVGGRSVAGKARMKLGTVTDEHGTEYVINQLPAEKEEQVQLVTIDKVPSAKPAQQLGRSGKAAAESASEDSIKAIAGNKEEGFFLRGAKLNDVFTFLAKSAGLNYFHNPALEGSEYLVTGRLQEGGDPLNQMEELGLMYGVTFLQDGKTVQSLRAAEKKPAAPSGLDEKSADEEAFSTFSLHVSDVSFKLAQAALAKGEWPEASKVRIEEFVNAFDYGDPMPDQNEKVASRMEQAIHPFLQQRNLLRVSMRTAAAGRSGDTPLRLTLLLDNSGSMERIDRQETVRRAFALLAQQLKPIDQVTLISFARQPRLLADKVSGAQADQLVQLVANIPSEGGTNLEAALQLAFEKAREQKIDSAQNRVIMLTDGAANLGDAEPDSLAQMIETMRDAGIAFDAAGIGAEGLNDEILEALTRKGDGRYYLLDQPEDADEGFARQIAGALRPAAKNVKVQVEFNPERVGKYKLLGFEKHLLKKEDFRNDKVDAAEMAAAEAGVAVYQFEAKPDGRGDVGSVSVRFLDMSSGQMVEKRWPIPYQADAPRLDEAAPSLRIAATSALLAAKLKGEALGQSVDLKTLSNYTAGLPDRYRNAQRVQQLQEMINQARAASR